MNPQVPGGYLLETSRGCIAGTFIDDKAAIKYAKARKLHREYGRYFFEYAPGKFETVAVEKRELKTVMSEDESEN
jgi:hypothetical protein